MALKQHVHSSSHACPRCTAPGADGGLVQVQRVPGGHGQRGQDHQGVGPQAPAVRGATAAGTQVSTRAPQACCTTCPGPCVWGAGMAPRSAWVPFAPAKCWALTRAHSFMRQNLCSYAVKRVLWSPHAEHLLASCSYDMTVKLWDTASAGHALVRRCAHCCRCGRVPHGCNVTFHLCSPLPAPRAVAVGTTTRSLPWGWTGACWRRACWPARGGTSKWLCGTWTGRPDAPLLSFVILATSRGHQGSGHQVRVRSVGSALDQFGAVAERGRLDGEQLHVHHDRGVGRDLCRRVRLSGRVSGSAHANATARASPSPLNGGAPPTPRLPKASSGGTTRRRSPPTRMPRTPCTRQRVKDCAAPRGVQIKSCSCPPAAPPLLRRTRSMPGSVPPAPSAPTLKPTGVPPVTPSPWREVTNVTFLYFTS